MNERIESLREWLVAHPDDRFAAYSLALELHKADRSEEAVHVLRDLLTRHPTSGAGHYQHGRMLLEMGREEEARSAWEAGLAALTSERIHNPDARRSAKEIEAALADLGD